MRTTYPVFVPEQPPIAIDTTAAPLRKMRSTRSQMPDLLTNPNMLSAHHDDRLLDNLSIANPQLPLPPNSIEQIQ